MKRWLLHRNCFKLHPDKATNSQLSNGGKSNGKHLIVRLLLSSTVMLNGTTLAGSTLVGSSLIGSGAAIALNLMLAPVADAYTLEEALTVYWVEGEDYAALSRRAEIAARSITQQWFDSDILLTRVVITVLGDNGGQTAPILTLNVSRNDWRSRPDPQRWATYYHSTRTLLDLNSTPTTATQPAANITSPAPASTPARPNSTPYDQTVPPPADSASPPTINIPATPPGQVGLPRSILR